MRNRSALSFVEFMGCLVALCGGAAIGALYLGVDLNNFAYGLVKQTNLVDPTLIGLKNPDPEAENEINPIQKPQEECISDEPVKATDLFADEINAAIEETSAIESALKVNATQDEIEPIKLTSEEQVAATHAYWEAFASCIREEIKGRSSKIDNDNWQLLHYLTLRKKGHEFTIQALNDLERTGVDKRLLDHVDDVLAWHESGLELYSHAENLLTNGPNSRLTGPFAQSWQSSSTQLRMEERLVRNKHNVILGYLNHTYPQAAPFSPIFGK